MVDSINDAYEWNGILSVVKSVPLDNHNNPLAPLLYPYPIWQVDGISSIAVQLQFKSCYCSILTKAHLNDLININDFLSKIWVYRYEL